VHIERTSASGRTSIQRPSSLSCIAADAAIEIAVTLPEMNSMAAVRVRFIQWSKVARAKPPLDTRYKRKYTRETTATLIPKLRSVRVIGLTRRKASRTSAVVGCIGTIMALMIKIETKVP
jgi:hypothetical protein